MEHANLPDGVPPPADPTRRDFVAAVLAAGFAAAVRPITARTAIITDQRGINAAHIEIPVFEEETIPAYAAMPNKGRAFPVVLVVQEIFGVHEHIRDICRRLAKLGYLAVAPALYARQGDPSKLESAREIMETIVSRVPDLQVMRDLDATVAWAEENSGDAQRLGITGFCWGGRIVWLYAARNPRLDAGVAWYGRLTGRIDALHPLHPIDVAQSLKAPVLGLYGGADPGIPLDDVEKMRELIDAAGGESRIVVYPDAPHAFFADYRPSYRQEAAEDGWQRMREWFKEHGVA